MRKRNVMKIGNTYVTHGPPAKYYAEDVEMLRDFLQIGDKVLAEVYTARDTEDGTETVLYVTILAKYPHVAVTDRGTLSWVNILLHNPAILRKARDYFCI